MLTLDLDDELDGAIEAAIEAEPASGGAEGEPSADSEEEIWPPFLLLLDVEPEYTDVAAPRLVGVRIDSAFVRKLQGRMDLCLREGFSRTCEPIQTELSNESDFWELVVTQEFCIGYDCFDVGQRKVGWVSTGDLGDMDEAVARRHDADADPEKWKRGTKPTNGYRWVGDTLLYSDRNMNAFVRHVLRTQPEVAAQVTRMRMASRIAEGREAAGTVEPRARRAMEV